MSSTNEQQLNDYPQCDGMLDPAVDDNIKKLFVAIIKSETTTGKPCKELPRLLEELMTHLHYTGETNSPLIPVFISDKDKLGIYVSRYKYSYMVHTYYNGQSIASCSSNGKFLYELFCKAKEVVETETHIYAHLNDYAEFVSARVRALRDVQIYWGSDK
jgi:hypothetical protein